jgi:hypothetical protein
MLMEIFCGVLEFCDQVYSSPRKTLSRSPMMKKVDGARKFGSCGVHSGKITLQEFSKYNIVFYCTRDGQTAHWKANH